MSSRTERETSRGFSLLEMVAAIAIIFILAVLTVPALLTEVYTIQVRYSATDLSGLLQSARMEGVRKNSFYSVQSSGSAPVLEQVVDKNGTVDTTIPPAVMARNVNVFFGSGSGAPNEGTLLTTLNYNVATSVSGLPTFNSRGLPCMPVGGTTCPVVAGQGFVFFLSRTTGNGGSNVWSAVAVTPSGRCQVWAYDGTNWTQQ